MKNKKSRPLMGTNNILQLQDNGYKSTVSAICELIDNSIQASAQNIEVVLVRNTTSSSGEFIDEVLIVDDGDGMDTETFDMALQMSSGTNNNAKAGLGKYGQGLPNASISQAKRVEVYTFQKKKILYNYIDLDEIYKNGEAIIPDIEEVDFIDIPLITKKSKKINSSSGTIIRWVKPNRIKPKTAKTLSNHIEMLAGRIYRNFLRGYQDEKLGVFFKCNMTISVYDYNGEMYSQNDFLTKNIIPFDPMFLMDNTQMGYEPTSILFSEPIKEVFKVEYGGEIIDTEVEIKLSYCPSHIRVLHGRNAGEVKQFGGVYLKRNLLGTSGYNNISIMRSGREIDAGNFGFIHDISESTNRWWSAEIIVDPVIDSIIGIDNKKQQASNIHYVDLSDGNEEDLHPIIIWIIRWLTANIKEVKKALKMPSNNGPKTPVDGGIISFPGEESEAGDPGDDEVFTPEEMSEIEIEFFDWIKKRYPDYTDEEVRSLVKHALSIRDNHIFIKSDLGDTDLYSYSVFGKKVLIEINYRHSYYDKFVKSFEEGGDEISVRAFRLLLGAMVNADIRVASSNPDIVSDRRKVRNRMAETLDDYITDLVK